MVLTPELKRLVAEPTPLVVAKSTLRARVHRRATADYIGVKRYNEQGEAIGEIRFRRPLHQRELHRADAQHSDAARKAEWVMHQPALRRRPQRQDAAQDHRILSARRALADVARGIAGDARGVLHLLDRPRARVFTRRDRFNRFRDRARLHSEGSLRHDVRARASAS
jgi:glutamate dehydrogenase